ncbi:MAG: 4-hydroxythreonine-4-phosphate dehydrogenase PdxA [Bdellovibrionales bacterium]|nr:4-hydroxythreonine-4-phosphate dehydrogenase PdxA [Bdellovibrionales bacterium]
MNPIRIAITSGDIDGIGSEVVSKALAKVRPKKNVFFYLWRSPRTSQKDLRRIDRYYKRITVSTWPEALKIEPSSGKHIIDIASVLSPAKWVELSAKACMHNHLHGIATAPLSKKTIFDAKINAVGHTEILQTVSGSSNVFMTFIGKDFHVLLVTGHLPLAEVSNTLNVARLFEAGKAASQVQKVLPKKWQLKPLAFVGLNPHAGEEGIIGSEEKQIFKKALSKLNKSKIGGVGPLVPDVAFLKRNWSKYSIYVCPYHDQGLIPFKMIHGQDSGVHITSGLPFVRTSVDHGTAKDIFDLNKANPNSMIEAINWAVKLCELKTKG